MSKLNTKRWIGWHFLPADGYTRHSHEKVRVGGLGRVEPPLTLCVHGLHASRDVLDALCYAPGPIACMVELRGVILESHDKACATERRCLAKVDATTILHEFACWCTERVLWAERKAGREPDPRSWAVVRMKREWLAGRATDRQLAAAGAAAGAAAWTAAGAAAETAGAAAWTALSRKLTKTLLAAMNCTADGTRRKPKP